MSRLTRHQSHVTYVLNLDTSGCTNVMSRGIVDSPCALGLSLDWATAYWSQLSRLSPLAVEWACSGSAANEKGWPRTCFAVGEQGTRTLPKLPFSYQS